ncbi:glycosyltransferase family 2 protein [Commensalibacter oyaizuii]|uniref:Glycosyltransferase family 2 protein n=1 Tax=Commensalibacter oyaizuii TaxID=3043873 RepID=A0ABT6Q2X6_9PROT|nr:glycosyltransferase family 2 protein [Commensalibacter sp. TBRC 16381]MDI2091375.1 glycosyltransferase family 2 protein [Commensalibacter sp. TBRC 16381]
MMQRQLPTVAVALFVKNEFSDIKGWISWYFALGVKTLFIFDDHSTDGTWDILQAAAKCYDIRLYRTDPVNQPSFYWRQRDSFLQALAECRGKYDWLGFLDGDEYVYIKHFDSLPEFFYRFDHADAVAFSWRIYGHSNQILRPRKTAVEAYLQHSTPELGDNHLIKSFVRPDKMGTTYHSPHWFDDISIDRYVRPHGGKVKWGGPDQEIDWSDAFVMHYICRSMDHFIQRVKKRPDNHTYWKRFDHSSMKDEEPLRFIPKVYEVMEPIHREMLKSAILKIRNLTYVDKNTPREYSTVNSSNEMEIPSVVRVRTYFETFLYCDPTGHVIHATEEHANAQGWIPMMGLMYPSTPDLIVMHAKDNASKFLRLQSSPFVYERLIFRLAEVKEGKKALLSLSGNLHFYTCFLPTDGRRGLISADRLEAKDYETVNVDFWYSGDQFQEKPLPFIINNATTVDDIIKWVSTAEEVPSGEQFLRVLHAVPSSVRDYISEYIAPGLLWPFL